MLKKNKKIKKQNTKTVRNKLIKKPFINCNLQIRIKMKNSIIENKPILLKNLITRYNLSLKSQSSKQQQINRTVVNKGPTCHSKSKETYITTQNLEQLHFYSNNLAQSLKFFIESEFFFLKKGSNKFNLSMII